MASTSRKSLGRDLTVAVVGATGAVGARSCFGVLEERRNFPIDRLVPLASTRSAGKTTLLFAMRNPVTEAGTRPESAFEGVDLVHSSAATAFDPHPRVRSSGGYARRSRRGGQLQRLPHG